MHLASNSREVKERYIVYFQKPGVAEAELETDVRTTLRKVYYSISGDAPEGLWVKPKPASANFLDGLIDPPMLPSWLSSEDLDYYVAQFEKSGFRGPLRIRGSRPTIERYISAPVLRKCRRNNGNKNLDSRDERGRCIRHSSWGDSAAVVARYSHGL